MFFEGPPIISQSAAPLPVESLIMRASFVSSGTTLKQTIAADNTPETVLFNNTPLPSPDLVVDLLTGETTAVKDFSGMVSFSGLVLREVGGGVSLDWGVFIEVFDTGLGEWVTVPDSLRPFTLSKDLEDEKRPIDYTVSVSILAGQKFRWRHYTTDATKTVSLVAYNETATLPGSAAVIMSFWGIKP